MSKLYSKLTIQSRSLVLLSAVYFAFVLNISFWRFVLETVPFDGVQMMLFGLSLLILMLVALYLVFSVLAVPYLAKPILIVSLILSASANYFMFEYGTYIDAEMVVNILQTNIGEALDLITVSYLMWLFLLGVVPAVLICIVKIKYDGFFRELKLRSVFVGLGFLILIISASVSYKQYASFGRNYPSARKLINTFNYHYAIVKYLHNQYGVKRQFVKLDAAATTIPYEEDAKTVLIIVVGETARAKNFSLNGYARKTNPLLEKQDVVYLKNSTACGTSTAVSVPCMFSHLPRREYDVDDAGYMENLLDILQTAGYDVLWLENNGGCKGVCARVKTENLPELGNPKYCNGRHCLDEVLIYDLEDRLKKVKKDTVIVLHSIGSHGPTYYRRYTDEFRVFTPTCDTAEIQTCTQKEIVNTYDNTILYTDYILSSIIDTLNKFPEFETGMFYASDHGESLGENNVYLHSLPYAIAPREQIDIPMLIWLSDTMKKYNHINYSCLNTEASTLKYQHSNIFHSIAALLEVKTTLYNKEYDLFKNCRTKALPSEAIN